MNKKIVLASVMGIWGALSPLAFASPETAAEQSSSKHDSEIESQIDKQKVLLVQIDEILLKNKNQLRRKTEAFYQIQQKPSQGPLHMWQKSDNSSAQRKELALKMMGLALRESVKDLEVLENRRLEAQAELEWLHIQKDELSRNTFMSSEPRLLGRKSFQCRVLPLTSESNLEVSQGFGPQKDLETGIQWNSLGWWIPAIQSEVKACDSGRVVFVGEISGRGRVVMLDHGAGHLTVYANLNPDSAKLIKKGQKVEVGMPLGLSLDRVYFEYRDQGTASDPKNILRSDLLSRVSL